MCPHELHAAVSSAPVGADEYGIAIHTLYVEANRYLNVHNAIDFEEG